MERLIGGPPLPENINLDYPPSASAIRVAVHYYDGGELVHPEVRIFCGGQLAADLGPTGYSSAVSFSAAESGWAFWKVADVVFDTAGSGCTVTPLLAIGDQPWIVSLDRGGLPTDY
jgi:hypothetical protein